MNLIEFHKVDFGYRHPDGTRPKVLERVSLDVARGEYLAVLGGPGSGKTTFLKLCNGLLSPDQGEVSFLRMDSRNEARLMEIRRGAAMVFQDPDSQIIGTTVAEDVAFGPENLGLPPQLVRERVQDALHAVSLQKLFDAPVHQLDGWQKLRLAIAGAIAMRPDCLLVDDAAAALDAAQKKELLRLLHALNRERGIAVLHATGDFDEAAAADRMLLIDEKRITLDVTATREVAAPGGLLEAEQHPFFSPEREAHGGRSSERDGGWQAILAARYLPGASPLHRCDPRTKLSLALILMAAAFTLASPAALMLLLAVILGLGRACGSPLRRALGNLRPILCLALVAAAVNLAGADGVPLAEQGVLRHICGEGVALSVLMVLRLLLMAATASLLTCTTTPGALGEGVARVLRPLARLGVPVSQLAAMLQVSLRLLPVLVDEAEKLVRERSASRGPGKEPFMVRLAGLPPLLASLFGRCARRGESLAEAMEARCYRGPASRSRMDPLSFSAADLAGVALLLVVLVAAAGIEYLQG